MGHAVKITNARSIKTSLLSFRATLADSMIYYKAKTKNLNFGFFRPFDWGIDKSQAGPYVKILKEVIFLILLPFSIT